MRHKYYAFYISDFAKSGISMCMVVAILLTFLLGCGGGGNNSGNVAAPPPVVVLPTIRVVDGDTIDIDEQRYRLSGFDAPERHQKCRDASGQEWACGRAATEELERLASLGELSCSGSETDRYGRIVGSCSAEGKDLGAALVNAGLAVNDPRYSPSYAAEEKDGRGIHSGRYLAPWDWRSGERLGDAEPNILVFGNTDINAKDLQPTEESPGEIDLPALDGFPNAAVYAAWVSRSAYYVLAEDEMSIGVSWAPHFPATNPKELDGEARWIGLMVGADIRNGDVVTGRAFIDLRSFSSPRVDISFTRVRGSGSTIGDIDMRWEDVPVLDGAFMSDNGSGNRIEGRFYGDRHQEVGGVFERQSLIGAFGASRIQ